MIGIHLSILLVVEGFQFQNLTVLPIATFIILSDVVQLRVKREEVEVQGVTLNNLNAGPHVADKLTSSRSGRVNTDGDIRFL